MPRVWDDAAWHKKQAPAISAKDRGQGRSRAWRREHLYSGLRAYSDHYTPLLATEWRSEQQALAAQIERWPPEQLEEEGWLLRDLQAQRINKDVRNDPRIRTRGPHHVLKHASDSR